jgi:hypothetical protein
MHLVYFQGVTGKKLHTRTHAKTKKPHTPKSKRYGLCWYCINYKMGNIAHKNSKEAGKVKENESCQMQKK